MRAAVFSLTALLSKAGTEPDFCCFTPIASKLDSCADCLKKAFDTDGRSDCESSDKDNTWCQVTPGPSQTPPSPPPPPPPAPSPMIAAALQYLGAQCDSLTAVGCLPYQLPVYQDQPFIPQLLLKVNVSDIFVDQTQITDQTTQVSAIRSASAESEAEAGSFGISGSVPYDDLVFSGGIQHQHLVESMYNDSAVYFYSEAHREMIVYTASLTKPQKAVDGLQQDIDDLPYGVGGKENKTAWLNFFAKYGTHYVNSVTFGGISRQETIFDQSSAEQAGFTDSDSGFYLGASFENMVGLNVSWDKDHTQDQYSDFVQFQLQQNFFAVGGDESIIHDYPKWLGTVEANPVAISTTLRSLADLLTSKNSTAALQAYFDACPSTDQNGVCNGYGRCDPLAGTCTCSSSSTLDEDGNCYVCPKDSGGNDCSGRGTCDKGRCQCHMDEETQMGWTGIPGRQDCSQPCGQHTYQAASDSDFPTLENSDATSKGWRLATTWNPDYFLADSDAEATCWCKEVLSQGGFYQSDDLNSLIGSTLDTSKHWENTRQNCVESDDTVCHAYPTRKCSLVSKVQCSFPLTECDNNVIVVPTPTNRVGPKAINASLDARAEPVQRFAVV